MPAARKRAEASVKASAMLTLLVGGCSLISVLLYNTLHIKQDDNLERETARRRRRLLSCRLHEPSQDGVYVH
jgi:hypothetical protein